MGLAAGPSTGTAQAVFPLASLDGDNGFRLDGVTDDDYSGRAVTGIGDINGDGIDDLAVGAPNLDGYGKPSAGGHLCGVWHNQWIQCRDQPQ